MTPVAGPQFAPLAPPAAAAGVASAPATIADPAPLGLAAFGITMLVLSVINAGLIDAAATPFVLALALPFGGIVEILAAEKSLVFEIASL